MACTDFGVNLGAGVVKDLLCGAVRQARYCYKFNTLVTDLGSEEDKLKKTRKSFLVQVVKSKANTEEPLEHLQPQLEEANNVIDKAEKLKADASKSCCRGVCPNWMCRYIVGKKAATITTEMRQLNERLASRLQFARRLSLRPMDMPANFILFECTKTAQDELLMALKNDNTVTIGFHGMGGCGKSSLLKLLHKALTDGEVKLFDKVAYVRLSNPPNILNIQDSIASWLGLTLTEKAEPERAARLSMRLNDGGKYLLILDNAWKVLNFEDIGIPVGENCKVLISTREQDLCTSMDCQKLIHLSLPTKGEAWDLFQMYAGVIEDTLKDVAQEIAGECERLPIALKAVASTLKGKPADVWKEASKTLREGRLLVIDRGVDDPYLCLKLSFDSLEDEEERSLFLLCALFPEDSEIDLEILIKFAFGLDIFENVKTYERARTRVIAAINKITEKTLLQAEEGQRVRMHGLMRDMALAVAEKNTQVIEEPRQNLEDLREKDFMKDITRLSCHDIYDFPDQLNCPKLEILFVSNDGGYSSKFRSTFFKETKELKVLAILNTPLRTKPGLLLPQSIKGLRKLQTLCLTGWTIENISVLGKLDGLHTIKLLYCTMSELPKELAEIGKLKLLQVSWCSIEGNLYQVLERCLRRGLEELYFVENEQNGYVSELDVDKLLHEVACSTALQRYHLEIGSPKHTFMDDSTSKFLSIHGFDVTTDKEIKVLAQKLEVLFLDYIQEGPKNIIPDMIPTGGRCMNELTKFLLGDSNFIECLIDTTSCQVTTVFSKLLKLEIVAMKCLEALCRGPPPSGLFEKLEELFIMECRLLKCILFVGKLNLCSLKSLELVECSKLTSLFTIATAQTMVMLEVLNVRNCVALEHIIKDEEDDIISLQPIFPKLKQVSVKRCKRLECIIPASCAGGLSQLESLQIEEADELKHVFGKYKHKEDQNQNRSIDLPRLEVFNLINLPNIVSFCPQNYQITYLSLDEPYIMACPQLSRKSIKQLNDANAVKQVVQVEKPEEKVITTTSSHFGNWICQCFPGKKKEKKTKQTMADHVERTSVTLLPISEDLPQEYKTPALEAHEELGETSGSKEEADGAGAAEEEKDHNDEEDKDGIEVRKNNNVIEQSTTSYMDKGKAVAGTPSLDLQFEIQTAEVDQQTQEFDLTFDNQKRHQEENFDPVDSKDLREELIEKLPQVVSVTETKQALQEYQVSVPPSTSITATPATPGAPTSFTVAQYEGPEIAEVDQQKQEFHLIVENQEGLQKQNFYPVGAMNLEESNTEIANGSVHKDDPAPQEPKVATSSRDLIKRMPQVELELLQIVKHPQQALEEYKGALTSKKQHLSAEEIIDFHGLFNISAACACLLDEAFAKYPHLWNWHISQKTPRLCEWGYNCLAEMLAFLKSETPKALDDLKRKKFEDLYGELETFGFDKEWLASIRRRVMEMRADQLKSEASTLQHILNIAQARMASIEDDLSKLDNVFGL